MLVLEPFAQVNLRAACVHKMFDVPFFPPMLCVFSLVFIVLGTLMNMDSIMAET